MIVPIADRNRGDEPRPGVYPGAWMKRAVALGGDLALDVAGLAVTVRITHNQLDRLLLPVLHALNACAEASGARVLAGLAGIPGSGKSTLAAVLGRAAEAVLGRSALAVVGMDGWHWPNDVLDVRMTHDPQGLLIPLRQRKGGPDSFDVGSLGRALAALRQADESVRLPVYDRRRHDPVPDVLLIEPETRIVLIEGNYLLSDVAPWRTVSGMLRPRLFLECDPAVARERVIARHVRGGSSPAEAAARFESNDAINTHLVQASARAADFRLRWEPQPDIIPPRGGRMRGFEGMWS